MKSNFYIILSLKTPDGFESYGQFELGNNREAAYALFEGLKGNQLPDELSILHIDLMETVEHLPVKIKTIGCTIDELGCNTRLIAKEVFRLKNLKGYDD